MRISSASISKRPQRRSSSNPLYRSPCPLAQSMPLIELYPYVKLAHVSFVTGSGLLFATRGAAVLPGEPGRRVRAGGGSAM
jgi:hypothetical protein